MLNCEWRVQSIQRRVTVTGLRVSCTPKGHVDAWHFVSPPWILNNTLESIIRKTSRVTKLRLLDGSSYWMTKDSARVTDWFCAWIGHAWKVSGKAHGEWRRSPLHRLSPPNVLAFVWLFYIPWTIHFQLQQVSSLNLLRIIAEEEKCNIEDLNAGKVADWFTKDVERKKTNPEDAVLKWWFDSLERSSEILLYKHIQNERTPPTSWTRGTYLAIEAPISDDKPTIASMPAKTLTQ